MPLRQLVRPALLAGSAILAMLAAPAWAEEADAVPAAETGSARTGGQVYKAEFFTRFSPRTALEMLGQVPGFAIRDDGGQRGLGQATTNVLVNGQRLTSKSEDTFTQLGRIAAKSVVRIELVDAATLDVPGLTGQVANVIVKADGLSGNFAYRFEARPHFTDPLYNRFEASLTGKTGRLEYTVGLSNLSSRGGAGGETLIQRPDGSLIERRDDVVLSFFDQPKLSLAAKIDAGNGTLINLNGSYRHYWFRFKLDDERTVPGGVDRTRRYREKESGGNYELGGDLAFKLAGGQLKLIGLTRGNNGPASSESVFTYADGRPQTGDRYHQQQDFSETIARAEYGWKAGGADWQLSAEAAYNKLGIAADLATLDPSGVFVPVPFPDGTGGVKEDRYEAILSYSRPLAKNLSLQVTLGGEFSRLAQTGGINPQSREFWRPKGSLALAWTPEKGLDVSFKARRRVGQLNFGDFLARVFLNDNNANAGNGELVPPQSWEFELETKKTLGKWGNTTLRLYDYRIQDLVDIIPIGATGESPGNLDGGRRYGLEWTSTIELAPMGIKGAKLDLKLALEKSRVRDPLTNQFRPISETQDRVFEIGYRHDIPKSDIAYGFNLGNYHFENYYRLGEVGLGFEGPTFAGVFVEHKDVFGLTLRAQAGNLLNGRNKFDRTVYAGRRNTAPVLFTEHRDRLIGPIFSVLLRGNI